MNAFSPPPAPPRESFVSMLWSHLQRKLFAGILALIPLVVTVIVLKIVFNFVDELVQPMVRALWNDDLPGVGVPITVVLVYAAGVLTTNFLGRGMIRGIESVVRRIPLVSWIYNLTKGVVDSLAQAGKSISRVVIVKWPREGAYTVGFLTNSMRGKDGKRFYSVLIPTTPTPQSGLLTILPEEDVVFTSLTVDEGVKLVVSSGVISPSNLMHALSTDGKVVPSEMTADPEVIATNPGQPAVSDPKAGST